MIGGSLDMLSTGAVISNFPARGQGKVFLINDVEFATAQLWVREDRASRASPTSRARRSRPRPAPPPTSFSTPRCAPTHRSEGCRDRQPAHVGGRDVVHLRRGAGGRAVGAVQHPRARQGARRRRCSSTPPPTIRKRRSSTAGRHATTTTTRTATCCQRVIRGVGGGERLLIGPSPTRRSRRCRRTTTRRCRSRTSRSSTRRQRHVHVRRVAQACTPTARSPSGCSRSRTSSCSFGNIQNPVPASGVLRPEAVPRHREGVMAEYDYVIVGAGSAGCVLANRLSADPASAGAAARGRRLGPALLDPSAGRLFQDHLRHPLLPPVRHRAGRGLGRPQHRLAARPRARRLVVDQRPDLHPRPARGLRRLGAARRRRLELSRRAPALQAPRALRGRRERIPRRGRRDRRVRPAQRSSLLRGLGRGRRAVRPAAQPGLQRREHVRRRRLPAQHPRRLALERGDGVPAPGARPPESDRDYRGAGDARAVRGDESGRCRMAGARRDAPGAGVEGSDPGRRRDPVTAAPAVVRSRTGRAARTRMASRSSPTRPRSATTSRITTRHARSCG